MKHLPLFVCLITRPLDDTRSHPSLDDEGAAVPSLPSSTDDGAVADDRVAVVSARFASLLDDRLSGCDCEPELSLPDPASPPDTFPILSSDPPTTLENKEQENVLSQQHRVHVTLTQLTTKIFTNRPKQLWPFPVNSLDEANSTWLPNKYNHKLRSIYTKLRSDVASNYTYTMIKTEYFRSEQGL